MYPLRPSFFLQPHYDDVALSCGGTAARFARHGEPPLIVTLFGGEVVSAMVGDFAAWKHERWRIHDVHTLIETRRAEDAAAARVLGCPYRWLGLPDAIYRGRYGSDEELFADPSPDELDLAAHLAEELTSLPEWHEGTRICVPLGAGDHVDHQIAFETGARLARRGIEVFAYEDCPYAIHTPAGLTARLDKIGRRLGPPVLIPVADTIEARVEATGCYASQVPVIFRFTDDYPEAIRAFARRTGTPNTPAERFWPVRG